MSNVVKRVQYSFRMDTPVEIEGIEMGVMADGMPFLTARGLAVLCGVAPSTIISWSGEWNPAASKGRDKNITELLHAQGYFEDYLFHPLIVDGVTHHAFPEAVCMAVLEYYAFESKSPNSSVALRNYRVLARAGLRSFVYARLGYSPNRAVPDEWSKFHERVKLNQVPPGYYSVFSEMSGLVIALIRNGLPVDEHTVPDISVGQSWSMYWRDKGLDSVYGERKKCMHVYPQSYPQSKANPEAWIYPVDSLGEFRRWMHREYLPLKFPKYLDNKVRRSSLPASTVELLLDGVERELSLQLPSRNR